MPIEAVVQQVSVVYANWYLSTAAGDTADDTPVEVSGTYDIMVSAAITTPDARIHQLTVGGQTRWTIKRGGQVSTDPLDWTSRSLLIPSTSAPMLRLRLAVNFRSAGSPMTAATVCRTTPPHRWTTRSPRPALAWSPGPTVTARSLCSALSSLVTTLPSWRWGRLHYPRHRRHGHHAWLGGSCLAP